MPSFKSTARERITTPDSVRRLVDLIERTMVEVPERRTVPDAVIDSHILSEQEIVKAFLYDRYGGASALKVDTPWYSPPLSLAQNLSANNFLTGVTLGTSIITEQWVLKCTSADTEYSVTGSISGVQSNTGTFAADYTSDTPDVDISIASASWSRDVVNEIGQNDEFIFSVFWYNPLIVRITDYLTVAAVLEQFLSGQQINASDLSAVYYKRAMDLLNKLMKGEINLASIPDVDVEPEAILYRVDRFGIDSTRYSPDPDTGSEFRDDNVYPTYSRPLSYLWYRD